MSERSERMKVSSDALLALSAKWRKEAEELDLLGMDRKLHPYERAGYRGGAGRIRRMADELESANSAICLTPKDITNVQGCGSPDFHGAR